jgi:hypothetical protein
MYASSLGISGALHLGIFDQPDRMVSKRTDAVHFTRKHSIYKTAERPYLDFFGDEAGNSLSSSSFFEDSFPIEKNPEPFEKREKLVVL